MPITFRNDIVKQELCYPTDNFVGWSHEAGSSLCCVPLSLKESIFQFSIFGRNLKIKL